MAKLHQFGAVCAASVSATQPGAAAGIPRVRGSPLSRRSRDRWWVEAMCQCLSGLLIHGQGTITLQKTLLPLVDMFHYHIDHSKSFLFDPAGQ
jgi:hypothetical protein